MGIIHDAIDPAEPELPEPPKLGAGMARRPRPGSHACEVAEPGPRRPWRTITDPPPV